MWCTNIRVPISIILALGLIGASVEPSSRVLSAAQPNAKQATTSSQAPADARGDPMPPGALLRLGTIRFRHADAVKVMFAPNGKTLVSIGGGNDRTVRFWDPNSGAELHTLPARNGAWAAFAPDSKTLVSGSHEKPFRLWSVATGQEVRTFAGHQNGAWAAAFAPDGETLASVGGDNTIRLWSVGTGMEIRSWPTQQRYVTAFVFAPDGKSLASSDQEGTIRMWNVGTGKETHVINGHAEHIWSIAFAPDGKTLASASDDQTIRFWNPLTGEEIRALKNPANAGVGGLSFSPDGETLASAGRDNAIRLWSVSTGQVIRSWKPNQWSVVAVAFAPDGMTLASAGGDGLVRQWDSTTGTEIHPRPGHQSTVRTITYAPNGKTVVTLDSGTLRLWETTKGALVRTLTTRPEMANGGCAAVVYAPDSQTLATLDHADGGLNLWNAATGERIHAKNVEKAKWIRTIAFAPDGKTIALGTNDVRFWDVANGIVLRTLAGQVNGPNAMAFAPDGKTLATAGYDNTVRIWNVAAGKEIQTLWHPVQVDSLVFSPDGKTLATAGGNNDRMIRFWDVRAGRQLRTLSGHNMAVRMVAFSPDGKTMASGSDDQTIRVWETTSGKEIRSVTGHRGSVQCVAFAPDGKTLASGSADTTGLVWRLFEESSGDVDLSEKDLQSLWTDLAGDDVVKAYRAVDTLAAVPKQFVPFLRQRLPAPVPAPEPRQLTRLLADLDSDQFAVRQLATQELEKLGNEIEPALRAALDGKPSLERLQRLDQLLEAVTATSSEELRWQRAIQSLERMGQSAPKPLLEALANEAPSPQLRQQAAGALERLARYSFSKP